MKSLSLGMLPLSVRLKLLDGFLKRRSRSPMAMARYAYDHTAFYKRFFAPHMAQRFEDLPILKKEFVRDISPYDLLAAPHQDDVVYYGETTGSTGSPTPAFYTKREFSSARFMAYVSPLLDSIRPELKTNRTCINGLAFGFTIAGMSFGDVFEGLGGLVANVGSRSTLATPERIARAMARLKPVAMAAAPIDFLSWMRILEEDYPEQRQEMLASLKVLLSTAELCSRSRVGAISRHFGIRHVDIYACVEGLFTLPCTCGEMHLLPSYHTELFDSQLRPLGPYGTGRLVFTNLIKESTPMVRYLLDDWVTISPSRCPHGFDRSIVPHGRYELCVPLQGEFVGVEHVEEVLFRHGLFGDYFLVIEEKAMTLTVEQYLPTPVPADDIAAAFETRFGMPTKVTGVPFGTITDYRGVRGSKPILKIDDRRPAASQEIPEFL